MIDIDKRLVEICRQYLPEWSQGSFDDSRVSVLYTDAIKWLKNNQEKFDIIIADLTDPFPYTPSNGIYSLDFFDSIKKSLAPEGIFCTQSSRLSFTDMHLHCVMYSAITKIFPTIQTCGVYVPGYDVVWSFTAASDNVDVRRFSVDEIDARVAKRINAPLKYYDGETHTAIYALPKYVRERRKNYMEGKTDSATEPYNPVYVL